MTNKFTEERWKTILPFIIVLIGSIILTTGLYLVLPNKTVEVEIEKEVKYIEWGEELRKEERDRIIKIVEDNIDYFFVGNIVTSNEKKIKAEALKSNIINSLK